ncbi:MAG: HAD family hydrolase, partial [Methyloversatilis sp.]|nr:HAD family hydrolase [Methyloversatilis sp.]
MLIATDLDGTFLAGDTDARQQLYQLISNDPDITLVFVTGRGLEAVLPILSDAAIPVPHYVIADVGATVVDGRTRQAVQPLQADIDALWPGERVVSEALEGIPGLQRQEVPQQRRCSYFCDSDAVTDELHRIAKEQNCDLLYSADRYLDFLPRGVNKGSTLRRLVHDLGIDM